MNTSQHSNCSYFYSLIFNSHNCWHHLCCLKVDFDLIIIYLFSLPYFKLLFLQEKPLHFQWFSVFALGHPVHWQRCRRLEANCQSLVGESNPTGDTCEYDVICITLLYVIQMYKVYLIHEVMERKYFYHF